MNLREHVVLGGAAAVALSPVLGAQGSVVFFASSVLIDVDHYWDYLQRNGFRDWSWRRTFAFHKALFPQIRRSDFLAMNVFHTVEWFALVYVAAVWLHQTAIMAAFWGMVFHLGLDLARLAWCRAVFSRALSVVEYGIRRRLLRARGVDPDLVYREALEAIGVWRAASMEERCRASQLSSRR
jgi:hypothetical protein